MRILEQFVRGKHPDQRRCEDLVVVTDQRVAVIDGATDKSARRFTTSGEDTSGGRFAALVLADALHDIEPGTAPDTAVGELNRRLADAVAEQVGHRPSADCPGATIVVYDQVLRAVWRVGDCPFRIDDELHPGDTAIDRLTSDFRAAYLATLPADATPEDRDPGREVILPLLRRQSALANRPGEFGYGVVNGQPVPAEFIHTVAVGPHVREIVLASDGYPTLPATLADAEAALQAALDADPRCVGVLRSTKGLMPGLRSFDDRAWVRLQV